jgi:hypothetical protein
MLRQAAAAAADIMAVVVAEAIVGRFLPMAAEVAAVVQVSFQQVVVALQGQTMVLDTSQLHTP